jgi:hypothetical protein
VLADRPLFRDVAVVAQWLLVLAWFGLTGFLAWRGFATGWLAATEPDVLLSGRYWIAGLVVAPGLPVVGLVLAGLTRSWVGAVVFAVLLVFGLLLDLWLGPDLYRARRPDPTPQSRVTVCQEHSGGDNRCPGG